MTPSKYLPIVNIKIGYGADPMFPEHFEYIEKTKLMKYMNARIELIKRHTSSIKFKNGYGAGSNVSGP